MKPEESKTEKEKKKKFIAEEKKERPNKRQISQFFSRLADENSFFSGTVTLPPFVSCLRRVLLSLTVDLPRLRFMT